jgi:anti-anti-sigma regulatory factor
MPTSITQVEDVERGKTILRVEGSLERADAVLLERIAIDMSSQLEKRITLDLADLDFLDSEAAPILRNLEREHGFEIEGLDIFLQHAITEAESKSAF